MEGQVERQHYQITVLVAEVVLVPLVGREQILLVEMAGLERHLLFQVFQ